MNALFDSVLAGCIGWMYLFCCGLKRFFSRADGRNRLVAVESTAKICRLLTMEFPVVFGLPSELYRESGEANAV